MSVEVAGWFSLLGFVGLISFAALLGFLVQSESDISKTLRPLVALAVLLCSGAALSMVFQGFHLWNTGWDINLMEGMDPSTAGRTAARSRGKGGILLLAIQFFPQFLVFGYGGLLWMFRPVIHASFIMLGVMKHPSDTDT